MARNGVNKDRAARILIEAAYLGDEKAIKRGGISIRTLQYYRKRLAEGDPELVELIGRYKQAMDREWASSLPMALNQSVEFIASAAAAAKDDKNTLRNPMMISSIAGAMKLLADVYYTGRVIDARVGAGRVEPFRPIDEESPADAWKN